MAEAAKFCCLLELEHGPLVQLHLHQLSVLTVSLPKFGFPETCSVDQVSLELRDLSVFDSPVLELKGCPLHVALRFLLIPFHSLESQLSRVLP